MNKNMSEATSVNTRRVIQAGAKLWEDDFSWVSHAEDEYLESATADFEASSNDDTLGRNECIFNVVFVRVPKV